MINIFHAFSIKYIIQLYCTIALFKKFYDRLSSI